MQVRAGGGARVAVWAVLIYSRLIVVTWVIAPWAFPPMLLPLTRPLSSIMLIAMSAAILLARGRLTRLAERATIAVILGLCAWSIAMDLFVQAPSSASWSGRWTPYLGDRWPWLSGWTGLAAALICIAMLIGPRFGRAASILIFAGVVVAYGYVMAWAAGANLSSFVRADVNTFPLTQVALIILAVTTMRIGVVPRMMTKEMPDVRTGRRWDALIFGTAVIPVVVVALLHLVLQLPRLSAEVGNALVGLALAVVLFVATWRYIEADRRSRAEERNTLEEAERLAFHDPLTGLANRTLAMEALSLALARSRRSGRPVTVMFCDLDGLKGVNDVLGHALGDELITNVARRLQAAVRDEDVVARLGGDEFLVITERLESAPERIAFAERVLASVAAPMQVDGTELHPGISVGVAVAGENEHPIDVIRNADAAMYRAKANGRGRWEVFDRGMREDMMKREQLASELRIALMGREIEIYLQPIVRLQDRTPVAAEALARWRHPRYGLLDTRSWLPIAEDSANVIPIGRFVIASACRWLAGEGASLDFISINLSPRELTQEDLARFCEAQVLQTGIRPSQLAFEVADDAIAAGGREARAQLHALATARFRLFVDHFGTGHDALSTWRDLPIGGVKLDREVAQNLDTEQGIRAAAAGAGLAAGLRIVGVAGGIETQEQEQELKRLGWEFGQGFLFARPAPVELTPATAA